MAPLPEIVIPPKQLKQVRRDLYSHLREELKPQKRSSNQQKINQALDSLLPERYPAQAARNICIQLADTRDQHILSDQAVDTVMLPLAGRNLQTAGKLVRKADKVIWDIPFILFDQEWKDTQKAIRQLVQAGFNNFRLNNIGHFPLFDKLEGVNPAQQFPPVFPEQSGLMRPVAAGYKAGGIVHRR